MEVAMLKWHELGRLAEEDYRKLEEEVAAASRKSLEKERKQKPINVEYLQRVLEKLARQWRNDQEYQARLLKAPNIVSAIIYEDGKDFYFL